MAKLVILSCLSLGLVTVFLLVKWLKRRTKSYPLPPGPASFPLVGGLFSLPRKDNWEHYAKYKDLYGPISSISVFGQTFIILNDREMASELLDGRSSIYSDRPDMPFASMCDATKFLPLLRYGNMHRAQRKVMQRTLGSKVSIARLEPLVEIETRRFLGQVLTSPEDLENHIRNLAGSIILGVTYGYTVETESGRVDELIQEFEEIMELVTHILKPMNWLVDIFPFMQHIPQWMPGSGFKRLASTWNKRLNDFVEQPYVFAKQQMAAGTAKPSIASTLLEQTPTREEDFIYKWSTGSMYGAGSESTIATMESFFLAMVLYPEAQMRAQEEIDRIIGHDRLPIFSDSNDLPYVVALFKEVLRWHTVVPLCLPHVAAKDDVYSGYLIPKGSMIIPNIWLYNHDPNNHSDPFTFKPERFLGPHADSSDPRDTIFGFGRRICAGKKLSEMTTFIGIAMSLATLNIEKARDAAGNAVTPKYEMTDGFASRPKPFRCALSARSAKARDMLIQNNTS